MWLRLASDLHQPVRVLQQTMTSRDLSEWVAEYKIRAEEQTQAEMAARVNARTRG